MYDIIHAIHPPTGRGRLFRPRAEKAIEEFKNNVKKQLLLLFLFFLFFSASSLNPSIALSASVSASSAFFLGPVGVTPAALRGVLHLTGDTYRIF